MDKKTERQINKKKSDIVRTNKDRAAVLLYQRLVLLPQIIFVSTLFIAIKFSNVFPNVLWGLWAVLAFLLVSYVYSNSSRYILSHRSLICNTLGVWATYLSTLYLIGDFRVVLFFPPLCISVFSIIYLRRWLKYLLLIAVLLVNGIFLWFNFDEYSSETIIIFSVMLYAVLGSFFTGFLAIIYTRKKILIQNPRIWPLVEGELPNEAGHRESLLKGSVDLIVQHTVTAVLMRLIIASLLIGVSSFTLFGTVTGYEIHSLILTGLTLLIHFFVIIFIGRSKNVRLIYYQLLLVSLSGLLWWFIGRLFGLYTDLVSALILLGLIIIYGELEWPFRRCLVFIGAALLCCLSEICFIKNISPVLFFPVLLFAVVYHVLYKHFFLISNTAHTVLARGGEVGATTVSMLRVMAWLVNLAVDSQKVMLCFGDSAEFIDEDGANKIRQHRLIVKSLIQRIEGQKTESGILRKDNYDKKFKRSLVRVFNFNPRELLYERFNIVIDERDEVVTFIVPLGMFSKILGTGKVVKLIHSLASIIRLSIKASKINLHSQQLTFNSEKNVANSEHETNLVVHFVNNLIQDIVINIDEVRRQLQSKVTDEQLVYFEKIEGFARILADRITDLKLLKEMRSFAVTNQYQEINFLVVSTELDQYIKYSILRKDGSYTYRNDIKEDTICCATNQEFLATALRSLVNVALSCLEKSGKIEASFDKTGDEQIVYTVKYLGQQVHLNKLYSQEWHGQNEREWRIHEYLVSVIELAKALGGELTPSVEGDWKCFMLEIPIYRKEKNIKNSTGWLLSVDDNNQVLTFYAKIADALQIKHKEALSFEEAKQCVMENGLPAMVITDLCLTGSNDGMDLLHYIREELESNCPIVVITGVGGDDMLEKAIEAGATKCFTKPIGQKELFLEIRNLIQQE